MYFRFVRFKTASTLKQYYEKSFNQELTEFCNKMHLHESHFDHPTIFHGDNKF